MASKSTTQRISQLREQLRHPEHNLQAYIVYSEDAHQSEYIADCDKRRSFISNFTGSAGTAVVTLDQAALWTDGRYYLQASQQLDSNWTLMKQGLPETPSIPDWLNKVLATGARVGVDPRLISESNARSLRNDLGSKGNQLVPVMPNLVDQIWSDRPAAPTNKVFVHAAKYAGKSHVEKLQHIRSELEKEGAQALVVSALDEIAWLFNLRGSDINFNPVFVSYALVTPQYAKLYIDNTKLSDAIRHHLGNDVQIAPYDGIFEDLAKLNAEAKKVWLDPIKCNHAIYNTQESKNIVEKFSPITYAKSLKNEAELKGLRDSHLRDAAALITFFSWLEERILAGEAISECAAADKLDSLRSEQADFVSLSFETISGYGPNGAIIHYKPEPETCAIIKSDNLYLCDSGGQYRDGTTDVTRTIHFTTPTAHQKRCFTRVLQGHIALDTAVFPRGTVGKDLDPVTRIPLWAGGLDYRHGTGHGVGAFLNVHEGPQSISFRESPYKTALEPGMTITNEPGYYEDGNFGIRIENVLVVKEVQAENNFGGKGYLGFEHITFAPIQTKLIDTTLLAPREIEWVNNYNQECLTKVGPFLQGKPLEYLKRECAPLYV